MLYLSTLILTLLGSAVALNMNGTVIERSALVRDDPEIQPRQQIAGSCARCGIRRQPNQDNRIVGGDRAGLNEFPWRAALFYRTNRGFSYFCAGGVLSNNWIVTAAHCAKAAQDNNLDVYIDLGDHDFSTATETYHQLFEAADVIIHPRYNQDTMDNDIALIQLSQPYEDAPNIAPICLPFNYRGENFNGKTVVASGWGAEKEGQKDTPMIIRKVDLDVLSTEKCRPYFRPRSRITNNMLCTLKPKKDTCQGDSGGTIDYMDPETKQYMAIGIVSWGYGCARDNKPGVYTKVTNYLDWMQSTTGETLCTTS